jgi:hypothetical protein
MYGGAANGKHLSSRKNRFFAWLELPHHSTIGIGYAHAALILGQFPKAFSIDFTTGLSFHR